MLVFNVPGKFEEFIEAVDNAEEHGYDNIKILMVIADVLAQKNYDFERLESILKRIIEIDPNNFEANLRLDMEYKRRDSIPPSLLSDDFYS